jgi:hypothetical protein
MGIGIGIGLEVGKLDLLTCGRKYMNKYMNTYKYLNNVLNTLFILPYLIPSSLMLYAKLRHDKKK